MDHDHPQQVTVDMPIKDSVGDTFAPGTLVDHFKVIRQVGRGGMGEVYLARDTRLGRKVALKVIQPDRLGSRQAVQQFLHEARATAAFNHPHIVTIHSTGEHKGRPYVALEYLEGKNLRRRMEERPPGLMETLRLGLAVANALAEAHTRNILHRDLKPENVVLPRDGRLRVVDFGLAKLIQGRRGLDDSSATASSQERSPGAAADASAETASLPDTLAPAESLARGVRGTPEYMSPEQWKDEPVTPAIDVWALGVMLYELVCGRRPYLDASFFGLAFKVGSSDPVPPLPNADEVPSDVVELIHACLDKDPAGRPTAAQLAEALQGLIAAWGRSERAAGEANPFRGLQPFTEEHADLFFGRDAEINAFLERLHEESVMPVVGPSGAGKSSFVQAGVVPRLRERGPWIVLQLRPGRRPFHALAHRLLAGEPRRGGTASLSAPPRGERPGKASSGRTRAVRFTPDDVNALADRLRQSPGLLSLRLRELAEASEGHVALVVDQLEELATLVDDEAEQERFMEALTTAVDDPLAPVRVIFTLRDDFVARLALGPAAREVLGRVTVLRRPEHEDLLEILSSPVQRLGYRYDDPELVGEMVKQVAGEPACLPLLQFTASLLWERRDRGRRLLCRAHHDQLGGVAGALARNADGLLEELAGARAGLAREILLRLVTAEGTRRVLPRAQVLDGLDPALGPEVLNRLVTGRLLTVRRGWQEEGEEAELELVHESLVRTWRRLARWVEESREDLTFLTEAGQAAELWHRRGRRDAELWQGDRLLEAARARGRCVARVPGRVVDFIEAGLARERRTRRRTTAITAAVVAVLVVATTVSLLLMRYAQRQQHTAEIQRASARDRWAEAQREGARAALVQGDLLEARAKVRGSLEQEDSTLARALWWQLAQHPLLWRHTLGDTSYDLAFAPDGKTLAEADTDGSVYLIDLETNGVRLLRGSSGQVISVAFSADGLHLAAGSGLGVVRIWNLERGTSADLRGHTASVRRVTFSPDGRTLASASTDRSVALWDVASAALVRRLGPLAYDGMGLAYSPDGRRLYTSDHVGGVTAFDPTSGEVKARAAINGAYTVAVSPDGAQLATAHHDNTVRLWSARSLKAGRVLRGHAAPVVRVLFSRSGARLFSSDLDGHLRTWDVASGRSLGDRRVQEEAAFGLALHPNGAWLATTGRDRTVRLWDLARSPPPQPEGHGEAAEALAISPTGDLIASAGKDARVRLWSRRTGRQIQVLEGHTRRIRALAFMPDGRKLVSGSDDRTIRIWAVATGAPVKVLHLPDEVESVAVDPRGSRLASAGYSGLRLWDLDSAGPPTLLHHSQGMTRNVAFSPDGRLLAHSGHRVIRLWRVTTGELYRTLDPGSDAKLAREARSGVRPYGLAFSPDATTLASTSTHGEVWLWDLVKGTRRLLGRHSRETYNLAFHPDGQRVGVSCADGTARIWRIADGSYTELRGHRGEVNGVAFSPDGAAAATASDDGMVRLWDARTGRPIWRTVALLDAPPRILTHTGWSALAGTPERQARAAASAQPRLRRHLSDVAALADASSGSQQVCVFTWDGQLELWDGAQDRRVLAKPVGAVETLAALPGGGCAFLTRGQAGLYLPSGAFKPLRNDATALALGGGSLMVAAGKQVLLFDARGQQISSVKVDQGVTAVTRADDWIATGYRDGNIELRAVSGRNEAPSYRFEETPSSPVVRLLPGPRRTLIAGFASGELGIWNLVDGARLHHGRLHGALTFLLLAGDHLHAATELGQHRSLDLSVLTRPRCEILRQVWSRVEVVWEGGQPVRRSPDPRHPCAKR